MPIVLAGLFKMLPDSIILIIKYLRNQDYGDILRMVNNNLVANKLCAVSLAVERLLRNIIASCVTEYVTSQVRFNNNHFYYVLFCRERRKYNQ